MNRCAECGSTQVVASVLPEYDMDLGGITVRLVKCVIHEVCQKCDGATIGVPDLDGLTRAVTISRALVPFRLTGRDVRFMRHALDMTGKEFAAVMEVTPETVSRWENSGRGIGSLSEKLLRHTICALLYKSLPAMKYDPEIIAKMRVLGMPKDFKVPVMELRRVVVKDDRYLEDYTEEGWDNLLLPSAACFSQAVGH